jgi:hypothetical protein
MRTNIPRKITTAPKSSSNEKNTFEFRIRPRAIIAKPMTDVMIPGRVSNFKKDGVWGPLGITGASESLISLL